MQDFTVPGRFWGRALADDAHLRMKGDAQPTVDGHLYGFQLGVDLFRFGGAGGHHDVGVYGGYTDGNYRVNGFAGGLLDQNVGRLDPHTYYGGVYWTYMANNGFYADTVVQASWYDGSARNVNGSRIGIKGTGILASVEMGYPVKLSNTWSLEPQAQLIAQGSSINDVAITNATVIQHGQGQLTGRVGLRAKGRFDTASGSFQPYLRANLWRSFGTTDRTLFVTPAATTAISTFNSALWADAGGGLTWSLSPRLAVYGEATHRFSLDSGRGVTGHSTGGSIGLKLAL